MIFSAAKQQPFMSSSSLSSSSLFVCVPLNKCYSYRGGGRKEGLRRRGSSFLVVTNMAKKDKRKKERAAARKQETKSRPSSLSSSSNKDDDEDEEEEDDIIGGVQDGKEEANKNDSNQRILDNKDVFFQSMTLASTYKQRTDLQLLGDRKVPVTEGVKALFYAPFVCCSHDENDTFNYANQAALNLWEFEWDDFIGMPSTKSADGEDEEIQKERRQLLDDALEKGVVYNYNGVRKSKNGKEFMVKDATLWTLVDRDGDKLGQAVKFSKVEYVASKEVWKVSEGGEWVKDDGSDDDKGNDDDDEDDDEDDEDDDE